MPDIAAAPSPERIMGLLNGFQGSAMLKAGIDLGLFTEIAAGAGSTAALAARCQASEHGVEALCDSLTVMGLLEKSSSVYRLGPDAAAFLDKKSPAYMGGMAGFLMAPEMMQSWSDVAAVVRRGGPVGLANVAPEAPIWIEFAKGMGSFASFTAKMMADLIVKGGEPAKVLDIAAGHGLFGIEIAKAAPGARIVAQDWPQVLEVARDNATAAGIADRWTTLPGSAFEVPFGTGYDVVLLTNFLHHFDVETCENVLRKSFDALGAGGRVVTLEFVPNDDGISPPLAAMFSMVMLVSTPKGKAYRYSELDAMHRAAGFSNCELVELPPTPQRLVVARKP
ncbi:MAG: Methyltransferase type 12 [Rhodospirillales bacterium]|nr:Methyltransferase type 12 [Rhodospirillales bacterium]